MAKGEIKALYFSDGTSATAPFDMGSAFAGEKNYMYKGSSNATGWTASGAGVTVATSTDSTAVPRPNTTGSGIQITGVSGSTAYAYYRFIIDPADYSKKLKIAFDMAPVSGYASNDFKVDVYSFTNAGYSTGSTRLALSTDSSAISALPNLTGTFKTTFDAPTATSKWVEVRIGLNGTNTHSVIFSDFIVGPGLVTQGAAIGPWVSFTPTITASGGGTVAIGTGGAAQKEGWYRRVGESMQLRIMWAFGTSGATFGTSGYYSFNLPTGFTLNTAAMAASTNVSSIGYGKFLDDSVGANYGLIIVNAAAGILAKIEESTSNANLGTTAPVTLAASDTFTVEFTVPIAEWAGAGTVNIVQNDVEYAYNTGAVTTAGASDTTSFAYGPAGAAIGSIDSTTTTGSSVTTMRVRFQRPIQTTDQITVEIDEDNSGRWHTSSDRGFSCIAQNTARYGVRIVPGGTAATDMDINFGNAGAVPSGATYGAASSTAWSTYSTGRWRVKKVSGGQAVGFSEVLPGISSGLVSANGLKGRTDGSAVATGYVGEKVAATITDYALTTSEADVTGASITLTKGVWRIFYAVTANVTTGSSAGNTTYAQTLITDSANTYLGSSKRRFYFKTVAAMAADLVSTLYAEEYVNISADTTYKLRAKRVDVAGTGAGSISGSGSSTGASQFCAVRVA